MKFRSKIIHKAEKRGEKYYYMCNHAIGMLDKFQLRSKTNKSKKKITCKRCRRYLYVRD